uniref:Interleukin n=1 Tax=Salarias fasciatus TaxID=181472 RepID=A0A672GB59_SALFA
MEHFITTIVWIVMLSDYLQANPINMKVVKRPFCRTQEHCIASALECFRQELNGTVRAECDVPKGRIAQWLKALQEAPECACEAWPLVTFSRFREQIEKLAEQITAGQNTAE